MIYGNNSTWWSYFQDMLVFFVDVFLIEKKHDIHVMMLEDCQVG